LDGHFLFGVRMTSAKRDFMKAAVALGATVYTVFAADIGDVFSQATIEDFHTI